jgi:hypothetical protein
MGSDSVFARITIETAGGNLIDIVDDPREIVNDWALYFSELPKLIRRMQELKSDFVDSELIKILLNENLIRYRGAANVIRPS